MEDGRFLPGEGRAKPRLDVPRDGAFRQQDQRVRSLHRTSPLPSSRRMPSIVTTDCQKTDARVRYLPLPKPQEGSAMRKKAGRVLSIGLTRGSLQDSTIKLFRKAGFTISVGSRSYVPTIDDEELSGLLIRAQEMARYGQDGIVDIGLVQYTRRFLKERGIEANVEFSWGATEVKAPRLADAIVELTETGSTLLANNLRIVDTIMESTTVLIANRDAWKDPWKKKKIENIAMLLTGALLAEEKVGLKMNVNRAELDRVLKVLPALQNPTISSLSEAGWFSPEAIVEQEPATAMLPVLKHP